MKTTYKPGIGDHCKQPQQLWPTFEKFTEVDGKLLKICSLKNKS